MGDGEGQVGDLGLGAFKTSLMTNLGALHPPTNAAQMQFGHPKMTTSTTGTVVRAVQHNKHRELGQVLTVPQCTPTFRELGQVLTVPQYTPKLQGIRPGCNCTSVYRNTNFQWT